MNDKLKKLTESVRSPKVLITIGILGMVLILLSSVFNFGGSEKEDKKETDTAVAEYQAELKKNVEEIVYSITGDRNAAVVLTLENGVKYTYVDAVSSDSTESKAESSEQNRESMSRSFVTVKTADGGEQALLVTETMPRVRGVAIVCRGGDNEETAEKIENAVMAALDITSKRVYIAGGTDYEKR